MIVTMIGLGGDFRESHSSVIFQPKLDASLLLIYVGVALVWGLK
jgi:hypothetical protein